VGGIGPKARAAARAGADLLLVPSGQEREAATALRDIARAPRVVAVAALTELLASPAVTDVPLEPEVGT
jgi:predicted S18 family serine protease